MEGLTDGSPLSVSPYPVAWKIAHVRDNEYRGQEYVRLALGSLIISERITNNELAFSGDPRRKPGTCREATKIMAERLGTTDTNSVTAAHWYHYPGSNLHRLAGQGLEDLEADTCVDA